MTAAQLATRRNAALARSAADLHNVEPAPVGGEYIVRSATECGRYYVVGPGYRCTCKAGLAGVPCRHAAVVYRVRHNLGRARVTVRG